MPDNPPSRVLFLGQYPLDQLNSAPQVRTHALWQAFKTLTQTDFITGTRSSRRGPLLRYLFSGRLRQVKAIYLEAATSTSTETDLIFLVIAKCLGIPIGIYIRDGFPLFNMIETNSVKNKLLVWAWHISINVYFRLADALFFPTQGLASAFQLQTDEYHLLPPGLRAKASSNPPPLTRKLLYVGAVSSYGYQGIFKLFDALDKLQTDYPEIQLLLVCREQEVKTLDPWRDRSWLKILHLNTEQLISLRDEVELTVLPINRTPYADLAMPVKLSDYLSLGKPVLATDSPTLKDFIDKYQVGMTAPCTPEGFEAALRYCFSHPEQLSQWSKSASELIHKGHRWEDRATEVLSILLGPQWRKQLPVPGDKT